MCAMVQNVDSNLFPGAHARYILLSNVFGTIIAGHRLAAAFVCGIRRTGAREILLGGLHRALGTLNSLVHPVPVLAHPCVCFFFSGCTFSFSGCHVFALYNAHGLYFLHCEFSFDSQFNNLRILSTGFGHACGNVGIQSVSCNVLQVAHGPCIR